MDFALAEDGVRLVYDDKGEGQVLLCLPGLTRNMDDFELILAHYGARVRVVRMDFRGRGYSDHAPFATYTPMQEARDVVALLDHLSVEKACVLGTSRGGLVALMLAVMAPTRLSGVIFNDIGPEIMAEGLSNIMEYIGVPPPYASLAQAANALPGVYDGVFWNVAPSQWTDFARRVWREDACGLHLRYDPALREAVAPAFAPGFEAPDLWPLFDAMAALPLGLIRGAQSNILSPETAEEMRRRRPDMAFEELADRGHVPFLDEAGSRGVIDQVLKALE